MQYQCPKCKRRGKHDLVRLYNRQGKEGGQGTVAVDLWYCGKTNTVCAPAENLPDVMVLGV